MSDQEIQILESQFPATSGEAFAEARRKMLAAGQSVLESSKGIIYEIFPDGRRLKVKEIDPPVYVTPGLKVTLR
jgi:hypothetical protein